MSSSTSPHKILLRIGRQVVASPFNKEIFIHAGALSFKLVLSLVPMLALIFSVAKGFGVQETLEPIIMNNLIGVEGGNDLIPKILEYVGNTNVKALGTIGLIFMVYTAISMISGVEDSFNRIWSITKSRSFFRKFSDYLSVLTIGPLLLVITISLSAMLSSNTITQKLLEYGVFAGAMGFFFTVLPWLASIAVLTMLYIFVPNTVVKWPPALIAGTIAGICWQCNQILFIKFQIGVARYNAIYGTFASLPIFMLWIYAGWIIVLYGALLNHACQHKNSLVGAFTQRLSFGDQEKVVLLVLTQLCREFDQGNKGSTASQLSNVFQIPLPLVNTALSRLTEQEYVTMVEESSPKEPLFMPARPGSSILLADFFNSNKQCSPDSDFLPDASATIQLSDIISKSHQALSSHFKQQTIATLYNKKA